MVVSKRGFALESHGYLDKPQTALRLLLALAPAGGAPVFNWSAKVPKLC